MKINDTVFGELNYITSWHGNAKILFCGDVIDIAIMIDGEEDGIFSEAQYEAFNSLVSKWEQIQDSLLSAILDYYLRVRSELGYADEENKAYPLIDTIDQIRSMIKIVGISIPYEDIFEGRDAGITFDCSWDIENGLGIRLINEEVFKIGYQDVVL